MSPSRIESVLTFCHFIGSGVEPDGPGRIVGSPKPATDLDSSISCKRDSIRLTSRPFFFLLSVIDPDASADGRSSRVEKEPEAVRGCLA